MYYIYLTAGTNNYLNNSCFGKLEILNKKQYANTPDLWTRNRIVYDNNRHSYAHELMTTTHSTRCTAYWTVSGTQLAL